MALQKYSLRDLFNRIYDAVVDGIGTYIKGQANVLLQKLTGVDQSVAVLSSGTTISAGTGGYDFDELEFDNYSQVDFVINLSLTAGNCTITVQQSQDGSNYENVPFLVNDGLAVVSYTYNSGDDSPLLITARRFGKDVRVVVTDDGTNDVTVNYLWATRRVI